MGGSDGAYGQLESDELSERFDSFQFLPSSGVNAPLDSFLERKHLDGAALLRVGARLSEHNVLAYGWPGGIRYRDMVTDERWTSPGASWRQLKIVPGGRERSTTVLVAEGETDAARLTMLYPGVDVAIMPGSQSMATRYADDYIEQLKPYELVLLATDPDRAGDAAYAVLSERLVRVARFTAPSSGDWCEWDGDVPPSLPLPMDVDSRTIVGGIVFEDTAKILDGDLSAPAVMVDDLLYVEGVHWIMGHPGCGKTTLMMHAAWLAMAEGRHVVWLDYEGGGKPTFRRLMDMGVPRHLLLDFFHYAGWQPDATLYLNDVAECWPGAFVVVDSASKSISAANLDENSPVDVTKWAIPIVQACKQHHLPVAVIDHVTKSATSKGGYARGAGSKRADTDVAWYVEAVAEFDRTHTGVIKCSRSKDREGYLPAALWYQVGDGAGGLTLEPIDEPGKDDAEPVAVEPRRARPAI